MSARVESTPVRESAWRPVVIAIVAALGLGALAVGMVRIAFDDDAPAAVTSVQSPLWDAQKLEAMEGRELAEAATAGAAVPALEPGELEGDPRRSGARRAGDRRAAVPALEPGELKAILEGRAVGQVGAEDPIPDPPRPEAFASGVRRTDDGTGRARARGEPGPSVFRTDPCVPHRSSHPPSRELHMRAAA